MSDNKKIAFWVLAAVALVVFTVIVTPVVFRLMTAWFHYVCPTDAVCGL